MRVASNLPRRTVDHFVYAPDCRGLDRLCHEQVRKDAEEKEIDPGNRFNPAPMPLVGRLSVLPRCADWSSCRGLGIGLSVVDGSVPNKTALSEVQR
jgi:hypothetical protein